MRTVLATALVMLAACSAPRARPLEGVVAPARRLPPALLPPGHRLVAFQWEFSDPEGKVRGEGAARMAAPDSVRLDLFVAGGLASGRATLIGDDLTAPGGNMVRRYLPPPPLMWAAIGRLSIPAAPDTVVRTAGDTLRADVGSGEVWRVEFVGARLAGLSRIVEGREVDRLTRDGEGRVRYEQTAARHVLTISPTRTDSVAPFDAAIWRP